MEAKSQTAHLKSNTRDQASPCPLCQSHQLALVIDELRFGHKANIYRCENCSLTFLDQNSFQFPKDFYESDYHQTYLTHVEPDALNPQVYYEKMKKSTKPWADRFRDLLTGKEMVLDIGCSTGHFIELIKDKAKAVYGSELSIKEIEFCQKTLNLDVSNQPLEKRFKPGTFDYITMIYVLEHIAKPLEFLSNVKKLLKPGGKLVILVPNVLDPLVNFYDIPEFKRFYFCIEHLFYYNPKTIKDLFNKAGLKGQIETLQEYPITNHLNWAYRRKPSDTLASRRGVPDVALASEAMMDKWEKLWSRFNQQYQSFLKENGFGDRLWCCVGKN